MKNVLNDKSSNVQKRNTEPNFFLTQISKELSQQIWQNIPGQVLGEVKSNGVVRSYKIGRDEEKKERKEREEKINKKWK